MAISYEKVASAAEAIKAEGGKPTLVAVHTKIGSGSMSTITKFMQRWKSEQPQQQVSEVTLPEGMKSAIINEMERYASQRVSVIRDEIDEAQQAINSLTDESESLQNQCEQQADIIDQLQKDGGEQRDKIQKLESEIARLTRDRTEYKERTESLTLELATSKASNDALEREAIAANTRASAERSVALEQINAERQKYSDLQSDIQTLSKSESRLIAQNEGLTSRLNDLKIALEAASNDAAKVGILETKLSQLSERDAELKDALKLAKSQLSEQDAEFKNVLKLTQSKLREAETKTIKLEAIVEILEQKAVDVKTKTTETKA